MVVPRESAEGTLHHYVILHGSDAQVPKLLVFPTDSFKARTARSPSFPNDPRTCLPPWQHPAKAFSRVSATQTTLVHLLQQARSQRVARPSSSPTSLKASFVVSHGIRFSKLKQYVRSGIPLARAPSRSGLLRSFIHPQLLSTSRTKISRKKWGPSAAFHTIPVSSSDCT